VENSIFDHGMRRKSDESGGGASTRGVGAQTIACIFVAPMAKEGEKGDVGVNTINARARNITRAHAWYL